MADITVPVPDERTAEFYQFFGLWLAGSLTLHQSHLGASKSPAKAAEIKYDDLPFWGATEQDYADAEVLWKKYSANARKMFGLLVDNPGKEFTGDQIAQECGIPNGAHGVAGVLAWPGRHGYALGRRLPSDWREDVDAGTSYYWIPADRAELFKDVREKVEAAA